VHFLPIADLVVLPHSHRHSRTLLLQSPEELLFLDVALRAREEEQDEGHALTVAELPLPRSFAARTTYRDEYSTMGLLGLDPAGCARSTLRSGRERRSRTRDTLSQWPSCHFLAPLLLERPIETSTRRWGCLDWTLQGALARRCAQGARGGAGCRSSTVTPCSRRRSTAREARKNYLRIVACATSYSLRSPSCDARASPKARPSFSRSG